MSKRNECKWIYREYSVFVVKDSCELDQCHRFRQLWNPLLWFLPWQHFVGWNLDSIDSWPFAVYTFSLSHIRLQNNDGKVSSVCAQPDSGFCRSVLCIPGTEMTRRPSFRTWDRQLWWVTAVFTLILVHKSSTTLHGELRSYILLLMRSPLLVLSLTTTMSNCDCHCGRWHCFLCYCARVGPTKRRIRNVFLRNSCQIVKIPRQVLRSREIVNNKR